MIKAVIFDMDGLMFDTERLYVQAWDYAGEQLGLGKVGYMNLKTLGMNITLARQVWMEEFGGLYDEEGINYHAKVFLKDYFSKNKLPVKPGLYALLEHLACRGYKLAVASSTYHDEVLDKLRHAGVDFYFHAVIGGDMVRHSKPDPEIYLAACRAVGEPPQNCMALEDSRNGILSAHRAGCLPVMVPDLWQPDEEIERILYKKADSLYDVLAIT
ncbi:MAG: HAD family phosphatase [Oscillospiraceae bacterium]|jgi:HAD superfamily hydrolase (TIGR01509 family)|nr:HAD family phosphatase [Oscillospiraceae bacterium]